MTLVDEGAKARLQPRSKSRRATARVATPLGVVWFALLAIPVPVARALPPTVYQGWILSVFGTIGVLLLFARVARPRYYGSWVAAGCFALAAGFVSSAGPGLAANMYVAGSLFFLWVCTPPVIRHLTLHSPELLRSAVIAFLISQSVSAAVAVLQATGADVWGHSATLGRSPGLATHPNLLGVMTGIAFAILLHRLLTASRGRVLTIAALALNLMALILTGSISAMMAAFAGGIVVAIADRLRLATLFRYGIALLATSIVLFLLLPVSATFRDPTRRFLQVTGQTGEESSLAGRIGLLEEAWRRISADPLLGSGMTDDFASVNAWGTYVHNFPLRAWMQGGVFLFIASLTLLAIALVAIVIALRRGLDAAQAAILMSVLGFSLTSTFFDSVYYWLPVLVAWGSLSDPHKKANGAMKLQRRATTHLERHRFERSSERRTVSKFR